MYGNLGRCEPLSEVAPTCPVAIHLSKVSATQQVSSGIPLSLRSENHRFGSRASRQVVTRTGGKLVEKLVRVTDPAGRPENNPSCSRCFGVVFLVGCCVLWSGVLPGVSF